MGFEYWKINVKKIQVELNRVEEKVEKLKENY